MSNTSQKKTGTQNRTYYVKGRQLHDEAFLKAMEAHAMRPNLLPVEQLEPEEEWD